MTDGPKHKASRAKPPTTRHSLLGKLKSFDDHASWREFFDTYWKLVYSVAIKSGLNDAEAQDVVQETFIAVHENIAGFECDRSKGSFKAWLLQLSRWRVADQLRRRAARFDGQSEPDPDDSRRTDATERIPDPRTEKVDDLWEAEWKQNLMDAAIERVKRRANPEHYQIFDLYVLREWPVKKVTQTLGVSAAKVYLAKHRMAAEIKAEVRRLEKRMI